MRAKIFADGADLKEMIELNENPIVSGFTTNPSILAKAGITDYKQFAQSALRHIVKKSISFEVFSDNLDEMEEQAKEIASWGKNVYVKIPITNTRGEFTVGKINHLCLQKIKVNVTAVFTTPQAKDAMLAIGENKGIVSVFAGRIADAGVAPFPIMADMAAWMRSKYENQQLLWASPRQVYDVVLADKSNCHIITMPKSLIDKIPLLGKNLNDFSLETVKMFYDAAQKSGYTI